MEPKKISFSFTKLARKPPIFSPKEDERKKDVQLIDCLEGQSIKVFGNDDEVKQPLIIPIKHNGKSLLDRIREAQKNKVGKNEIEDARPDSELTLDELAARQLLQEVKQNADGKLENRVESIPANADKLILDDAQESTLDDYENVPISDFGKALFRGMGGVEGLTTGKNTKVPQFSEPELRPKGLGLGANKKIKQDKPPPAVDKDGKELQLIKGAHAKIIAGKYKGYYCEVQGLDDESSRVIVETTIKKNILSLNEFLVIPVTKEEFNKCAKVLNNAKYEEYKIKSDLKLERQIKKEPKIKEELDSIKRESSSKYDDYVDSKSPARKNTSSNNRSKSIERTRSKSRERYQSKSRECYRSKSRERYRSKSRERYQSKSRERHKTKATDRNQTRSRHRHKSSSPSTSHTRTNKPRNRTRSKSSESKYRRSDSTESEDRDRKKRKEHKKSKKNKKPRRDSNSEDEYGKTTNKKKSKTYDTDSESDRKYKDKRSRKYR